jgi:hypothetical protein
MVTRGGHRPRRAAPDPPAPPEIIDLFHRGYFILLSGESEALKTWLAMAATASELVEGRGVVWVDGDDVGKGALLERLRLFGVDDDAITARFAYTCPEEPLTQDELPAILEVVKSRDCRLAVLDGFNPLLTLHRLDGTDIELFYRLL